MSDEHNPFAVVPQTQSAMVRSEEQRAVAEVQAAIVLARANPRDQRAAMDRILNACQRKGLAETALYSYSRGGTDISGPSIRLAEMIAQNWGNLQFGIRELDQHAGISTVQAYAWDVETNTRREVTFQVKHERYTKQGKKNLEDPRDIYETVANQGARRVRACVLAVIPGDVVEAAVRECESTMRANADTSPDGIAKMLEAFAKIGVTKQQIETRIQRRIESIQPAQVVGLKKIYASVRDGMSSVDEWFQPEAKNGAEGAKLADRVASMAGKVGQPAGQSELAKQVADAMKALNFDRDDVAFAYEVTETPKGAKLSELPDAQLHRLKDYLDNMAERRAAGDQAVDTTLPATL